MDISRVKRQRQVEGLILDHLRNRGSSLATAKELAIEMGYPWRMVARTLIRLAYVSGIEKVPYEWKSSRHRIRRCFLYRITTTQHADFPAWLMPQRPRNQ